jgi:hypothetical protein
MGVIVEERELLKRRGQVRGLFKPLAHNSGGGIEAHVTADGLNRAICVGARGRPLSSGEKLREVRYPSRVETVLLNYFERWRPIPRSPEFEMLHAYFHLDVSRGGHDGEVEEILAMHCDPIMKSGEPSYLYRRGPHLRISKGYSI